MNRMIISIFFACSAMVCHAKNPDIEGMVADSDGKPLSFVNVVLLSKDSVFIQGATSGDDGKFSIVCNTSEGILKATSIGYETTYIGMCDYKGTITLAESAKMLSEVTVNGQRPKTKLTGNSMVTSIQGSVLEKSGSAKEMLAKVPGMTQKGDDLEVLGKGTPIYYINGRKMNDKDELKRLRSEEIKEVEVITNPGAQYDATVSAVVRIKTIRREGSGLGYDVDLSHQQNLRYGFADPGATVNLRYRHKDIDIFGMANYWKWESANEANPSQRSYFTDTSTLQHDNRLLRIIEQESWFRNDWRGEGFNYNLGFNWQIADNHSVGARVERHDKISVPMPQRQQSVITQYVACSSDKAIEHNESYQEECDHSPYNWEGNLYYNGKLGKMDIDLNLDFLTDKTTEDISIDELRNSTTAEYATTSHTSNRMYAEKLVLSLPLWKGVMQIGSEMTFVKRKNKYQVESLPLPCSDSDVRESNIATFMQYACQIPKVGNLCAGLRYEHVGFDYMPNQSSNIPGILLTGEHEDASSLTRHTNDIFPSLSWARQWGSWQTALAYSIKTSRPSYWQLSETMQYANAYSLIQGDPKLKNATIHEVSANVRWKWANLYIAYEQREDAVTQWSYIYNDRGIILLKWINLAEPMRNLAAFLSASPTFGCYSPNWTIGIQKFYNKFTLADPREASGERVVRYTKPIGFFDLNNAFRFRHSWQLECNADLMTPGDVMNFRMLNTSFNLSFVVQKCWMKNDALCLRASITDVFQRNNQDIEMDCGYYTMVQRNHSGAHRLNVSLRYTFNAQKSKYKGTGAGKDAAGRMKK